MKALSIHPEYAMNIIKGLKTVEVRSWTTKYRGDVLICATARQGKDLIPGHALGVVTLENVVPMQRGHARDAMVNPYEDWRGYYAWVLKDPRPIVPFPMKGKLSLWECDHEIEFLPAPKNPHALRAYCESYWDDFLHARDNYRQDGVNKKANSTAKQSGQTELPTNETMSRPMKASEEKSPINLQNDSISETAQPEVRMDTIKVINNITETLKDDLQTTICKDSKVSIAAACFSMYAFNELKRQLSSIDEFRFIFTSPTFIKEKTEKQKREFYIPRLSREQSLYGTEFEIKLRNEMTQKAIAQECAEWIRRKARFKTNTTGENMGGFMTVASASGAAAYMPINGFTTVDIGCERGNNSYNMVNRMEAPFSAQYIQLFDTLWNDKTKLQDVTDVIIDNITSAYNENSPEFIYFMMLYNVFSEFLDDLSEDDLPNEATGFKQSKIWSLLYDFQKDAVLAIINKLEKYNGCILADSVGLGKTFTALAVIKYYENRNKTVLVLCPKKLSENWNTYKDNYVNNPIASDRLNYDVNYSSRVGSI